MNKNNNLLSQLYKLKLFGYNYINKFDIVKNTNEILPNNMSELDIRINNCNLCELSNNCKNKISYFKNISSKIIIIVPKVLTNNENEILKNILGEYLGLNIENVLILNIIKCNISNTKVNNNIFDICKDYTIKQIDIVKPKYILCFGEIYKYIVNNKLDIGEQIVYNNSKLFYFDDLSFLLRNPSNMNNIKNTFYKIKKEMEKN